ncbi:MAG: bifunctional methylenetetrahydrofolate dehydrogenase/methenyltetrahydrofolate cyclohydrolase FolD [Desulfovibrionaceae bacterium]|nr:bifunctional methylenetetrahydrofolate dehydrogenase/methenyltetrahydrofolate cyclohydrolase FolD [Desulfovibrionaceae bacterium]
MIILDGKATAKKIRAKVAEQVSGLLAEGMRAPGLAVILVGDDPASQVYVANKERACKEAGFISETFRLAASTSQAELEALILKLNARSDIDGILLQLPLPRGLDSDYLLALISPEKDVDGFHPVNMGRLALGLPGLRPCTPAGVIELLKEYDLKTVGKHAVVVGRSNIVGKPLAMLLAGPGDFGNATVTVCHSKTPDLSAVTRQADFIFLAIGRPRLLGPEMVRPGTVIIDVGINRTEQGLCGDADFEALCKIASAMTPAPGGVGPMTIAMLLSNTFQAYQTRN